MIKPDLNAVLTVFKRGIFSLKFPFSEGVALPLGNDGVVHSPPVEGWQAKPDGVVNNGIVKGENLA